MIKLFPVLFNLYVRNGRKRKRKYILSYSVRSYETFTRPIDSAEKHMVSGSRSGVSD